MSLSATNGDFVGIPPGMAVTVGNGVGRRAGGGTLANGVVSSGAPPRGVLIVETTGIVELSDWTNIVGQRELIPGTTYYLSLNGKLSTTASTQAIGIATSKTQLSVHIAAAAVQIIPPDPQAPAVAKQAYTKILNNPGPPTNTMGTYGDWWFDTVANKMYGPKGNTWPTHGFIFVT